MKSFRVVEADRRRLERWDSDVERSVNGTIFHLRRFLAYHGDRFRDSERFLLVLDGDTLVAQMPATVTDEPDGRILRSPYGASYGGPALQRYPTFSQAARIVAAMVEWMAQEGVTVATITPPIGACATRPLDVVQFAFLAAGFSSVNRDLTSVVALDSGLAAMVSVTSRARNAAGRAERAGVTIEHRGNLEDFWSIMEATFDRHDVAPTHTLDEFRVLADALPDRVFVDVAYHDRVPVAGIGYFVINGLVNSSFYLCQRPDRRDLNGLTLCVLRGLERAQREGYRWFDFGTSTVHMEPRTNVFRFKEQFGAAGQFRETFRMTAAT